MLNKQQKNQLKVIVEKNRKQRAKKQKAKIKKQKIERYQLANILDEYYKFGKGQKTFKQLNKNQKHMFNILLHGHGAYKMMPKEFAKLSKEEKRNITILWRRAQVVVNNLKREVCNTLCDKALKSFSSFFPKHDAFFNKLIYAPRYESKDPNIKTLKECGLTYDEVIIRFINESLLPINFFSLK